MTTHKIKIHESLARPVDLGMKTAEFRINDRGYMTGDQLEMTPVDDDGNPVENTHAIRKVVGLHSVRA